LLQLLLLQQIWVLLLRLLQLLQQRLLLLRLQLQQLLLLLLVKQHVHIRHRLPHWPGRLAPTSKWQRRLRQLRPKRSPIATNLLLICCFCCSTPPHNFSIPSLFCR
jgi:hypothetical protein